MNAKQRMGIGVWVVSNKYKEDSVKYTSAGAVLIGAKASMHTGSGKEMELKQLRIVISICSIR